MTISVLGNGSSLWGDSKGKFFIDKIENNGIHLDGRDIVGQVYLFGSNTLPEHCTDDLIELMVNCESVYNYIDDFIKELNINHTQPELIWSARNEQPDNGWAFYIYSELVEIKEEDETKTDN